MPRKPSPDGLRVGPGLSKEALAAGIYVLTHVPYAWPSRESRPRQPNEPLVVPVGRPFQLPFPAATAAEPSSVRVGYGLQHTITSAGTISMTDAQVDLREWTTQGESGAVLTPPRAWEGLVHLRAGSALVAYGTQGLANYREYVRRYVPWRSKRLGMSERWTQRTPANMNMMLASLMTGDIDADGTPELIAYVFVEWKDAAGNSLGIEGEIGIVWKDPKKEPGTLSGFNSEPGGFTIPMVAPAKLSGGESFVFSVEYCCAITAVRWAVPQPGQYIENQNDGEDGDWYIYLEPSKAERAKLLVAIGERVDWKALE